MCPDAMYGAEKNRFVPASCVLRPGYTSHAPHASGEAAEQVADHQRDTGWRLPPGTCAYCITQRRSCALFVLGWKVNGPCLLPFESSLQARILQARSTLSSMRLAVLLAFAVALLLDVAGTVLLGTGGRPERIVELLRLHFLLGESCIDLLALAAARGLLAPLVLLAGLRANRLRKVATAPSAESPPLLEPLQLNAETRAVPDAADTPSKCRLPAVTPLRCSAALAWVAVLYSAGKALARMLQAGLGIHGGMLPAGGTTDPTELFFWLTLSVRRPNPNPNPDPNPNPKTLALPWRAPPLP